MEPLVELEMALSEIQVGVLGSDAKRFTRSRHEAADLVSRGYRVFVSQDNPGIRFLRREGSTDILLHHD